MFDESYIKSKAWIVREVVDLIMLPDSMKVEKIFLVGSYAQGRQDEWSDLDFLVQLKPNNGKLYPNWRQMNIIQERLSSPRIHLIYGQEEAQKSLLVKKGSKFAYREIPLSKENVC